MNGGVKTMNDRPLTCKQIKQIHNRILEVRENSYISNVGYTKSIWDSVDQVMDEQQLSETPWKTVFVTGALHAWNDWQDL